MRVAFWSNYPNSGVTSNMIAMGAAVSLLYRARIVLTSNHYGCRDLGHSLNGNAYYGLLREASSFYEKEDYRFERLSKEKFFLRRMIDENGDGLQRAQPVYEGANGLYYYLRERYHSDYLHEVGYNNSFGNLVTVLEEQFDFVFMDLQSQGSLCSLEELEKADLVVINLKQDSTAIRNFFKRYESLAGKSIFLISGYREDADYLKRNFIRDYHIHPERVAVIPYNREIASGYADGRIVPYICNYINCGKKHSQFHSIRYIRYAAGILMRTLCDGIYNGGKRSFPVLQKET